MMRDDSDEMALKPAPTLREHFRRGFKAAHARRPSSFYLLLLIPLVLVLGAQMFNPNISPTRFAFVLTLLFIFFGVVIVRAVMDIFEITRDRLHEHRQSFQDTLGAQEFVSELGDRVRKSEKGEGIGNRE